MKMALPLLSLLLANAVQAVDMTVFGFEIGKPTHFPECKFEPAGDAKAYYETQLVTCENFQTKPDQGFTNNLVRFSAADSPRMVKDSHLLVIERNGLLMGVQFDTYGVQYQDAVFADLKSKYGKPSSVRKTTAQNGFGASFAILHASWKLAGITVTFDGADDEIDEGTVTVDTPEAAKMRASWESGSDTGKKL